MNKLQQRLTGAIALSAMLQAQIGIPLAYAAEHDGMRVKTATPIKHVIVIIGENRSFDHIFGTYKPKHGQSISNLLSKGIVNADGTPGPNFYLASQYTVDPQVSYYIGAPVKSPYDVLVAPGTVSAPTAARDTAAPYNTLEQAAIETDLAPEDLVLLTTGATGLPTHVPDTRVTNATTLPNGPFQLTGPTMPYDAYTGDTNHRFFQMWQQSDCDVANASKRNPSGCLNDLYPFIANSYSTGDGGQGNSMAFFNVNSGDAAYLKKLADKYTSSDNFHQSVMGGTMANHVTLATGDSYFYSDGQGNAITPPANIVVANPNPKPGTNNNYIADGNWTECSDRSNPGVEPIASYLDSLPYQPKANCAPGHFYVLNNTSPVYLPDGSLRTTGAFVPASSVRTIGDALSEKNIAWRYYGGGLNRALAGLPAAGYCQVCNPFQYVTSVMADATTRAEHLKDTADLYNDIANNTLPAVSFAKPASRLDGHPSYSKLNLFEAYVKNLLDKLDANPKLKATTAVMVLFDETGGYYDSGFIQPVDFFGDGPRVPLIVVSPFSKGGKVVHSYTDHVSVLKFIERNWHLKPVSDRSRDNLPNPIHTRHNAYVPVNMPAIGDLFDMFEF